MDDGFELGPVGLSVEVDKLVSAWQRIEADASDACYQQLSKLITILQGQDDGLEIAWQELFIVFNSNLNSKQQNALPSLLRDVHDFIVNHPDYFLDLLFRNPNSGVINVANLLTENHQFLTPLEKEQMGMALLKQDGERRKIVVSNIQDTISKTKWRKRLNWIKIPKVTFQDVPI